MKVLLYGVGSEYVLHDLALYLSNLGHDVTEFNYKPNSTSYNTIDLINKFRNCNFAFITSAHLTLNYSTLISLDYVYSTDFPCLISPLQLISATSPIISIYIPHDLAEPFGGENTEEANFYDIFDFIMAPTLESSSHLNVSPNKICNAGWIKNITMTNFIPLNDKNIVYFVSNFNFLRKRLTPKQFFEKVRPFLKYIYVKFPNWPGVEEYEDYLVSNGADIVPRFDNSTAIIKGFDIIITDSIGSIFAEASYFHKQCHYLSDPDFNPTTFQKINLTASIIINLTDIPSLNIFNYEVNKDTCRMFDYNKISNILK